MDRDEILKEFTERFVEIHFHDRFRHEAKKKPGDLCARICHGIEKIFSSKYAGNSVTYQPEEHCLMLSGHAMQETTWALAEKQMGLGDGLLIIDATGKKFHAETESEKNNPSQVYSGYS